MVALLTATLQDICDYEKQRLLTIARNNVDTPSLSLVHSLALYSPIMSLKLLELSSSC